MIIVTALRTHAAATKTEELVAGRVGMEAAFHFSPEWDGLGKTAVFEAGGVAKDVIVGDDPCIVPHECMIEGAELRVGIYGMSTDGTIVIPTVYALVGTVKKGADPSGDESYPPTPDVGAQAVAAASTALQAAAAAQEVVAEIQRRADAGEFDGDPGYTPVKGKDYFDGAPGKDGNDYVLTEADKVEIAEIAADLVDVPEGGSYVELDTTLTQSGKAADAKAVGDALAELESKIPEGGGSGGIAEETDPTVPAWAKAPTKPSYTAQEVGALPADTAIPVVPTKLSAFENDKGYLTEVPAGYATEEYVRNKIAEAELGGEEVDLSGYAQKSELPTKVSQLQNDAGYLTEHQDLSGYAKTEDIPTKPSDIGAQPAGNYALKSEIPSVPVKSVNGKTGAVSLSASDVGADASGTASSAVSGHNANAAAHSDIRLMIDGLTTRINALANSTDEDLDQMAELVAYIKNNKSLIDGITTSKVNVADIVNNLTTNVSNKPLSAAQGVALKSLVDGLQSGKLDASSLTTAINTALAQAKASGEFDGLPGAPGTDGDDGYTPVRGKDYYTEADKAEFTNYIATELAKRGQLQPLYANSVEECTDTTKLYVLPDGLIYAWMLTEKEVASGGYTNLLPTAKATDRKTIYGEDYNGDGVADGYKNNTRISSSGSESTNSGYTMASTGFMPAEEDDILRIKGYTDGTQSCYINTYDASNAKVGNVVFAAKASATIDTDGYTYDSSTGIHYIPLTSAKFGSGFNAVRVCFGSMDGAVFTINEEIKEGGTTIVKEYAWASTGHAFVPADYEDRIIAVENTATRNTARIVALEKSVESGSADETEAAALSKIQKWDKPVYDPAPVTLIADSRVKPALTTNDRTISAIYAKYRELMAAHPDYITETNMGKSSASDTFTAVDMLRFDFCEPGGLTQPDLADSARHETKPTLIFLSGIHTEWVGVWGLYYALEEIATNPDFDDVRRNAHIVVIPCANPFCLTSQTAIDGWRMSHVNANGVAIHNNFGVNHSTSGTVGEYNYGGSAPYSEPETQYIDAVMAEYPDAVAFVSCHNNDYSTYYGSHVIWASSATYHMCNVAFRLVDKMTKAWINKYGDTLKTAIDTYKINMDANDYRLGRATMSTSKGTEQLNATKYGIQGVNLEISRMMKVFSGNTDGTSEVMTHGAEVYANFMRTLLWSYDHKDKKEYAPNLPWSE